jgi:hypothetical protein
MSKAEERLAPHRQQRIMMHGGQADSLPMPAGQGVIAQQIHRARSRQPVQGQPKDDLAHGVQPPLSAGKEAVKDRNVPDTDGSRRKGDAGDGVTT